MSGSENELYGSRPAVNGSGIEGEAAKSNPPVQDFGSGMARFTKLSAELAEVMASMSEEVKAAAQQLDSIRASVDAKKRELKTLHGIEATAVALERLVLDYQRQKETLERSIVEQRVLWEDEKTNRAQEEKEYQESLRLRREKEEEAFRKQWAGERLAAQQKLEEELKVLRQESFEKQQTIEKECREREQKLAGREREWMQLIQELELFMSRLTRRLHLQPDAGVDTNRDQASSHPSESTEPSESDVSSLKEMLIRKSGIQGVN